jgi:hypothetical protein
VVPQGRDRHDPVGGGLPDLDREGRPELARAFDACVPLFVVGTEADYVSENIIVDVCGLNNGNSTGTLGGIYREHKRSSR